MTWPKVRSLANSDAPPSAVGLARFGLLLLMFDFLRPEPFLLLKTAVWLDLFFFALACRASTLPALDFALMGLALLARSFAQSDLLPSATDVAFLDSILPLQSFSKFGSILLACTASRLETLLLISDVAGLDASLLLHGIA